MTARFSPTSGVDPDVRRLTLVWHAVLPGGIVAVIGALHALVLAGEYMAPISGIEPLIEMLPAILGVTMALGASAALFVKGRLPSLVARSPGGRPVQRVMIAMFTLLGVADAPAIIAIAFYVMQPSHELALGITAYAFVAAFAFKPDFAALLTNADGTTAGKGLEPG